MADLNANAGDLAPAIQKLLDAGTELATAGDRVHVVTADDCDHTVEVPVVIRPDGTVTDLTSVVKGATAFAREQRLLYQPGPDARTGTAAMQSLESFIRHVNRFRDADSVVWADAAGRKLVAVLDYHRAPKKEHEVTGGEPRWGRHRSVYACPLSEAWIAWGGGKPMVLDQDGFASLLDARDRESATGTLPSGKPAPEPSTLISIANSLETYGGQKVKRERDPATGRLTLAFSSDTGFSGNVVPPPSFLIAIPVFQDAAPQVLEVRVRADVSKEGVAAFTLAIHAAGDVLRAAFAALCIAVEAETGLPVLIGTPEGTNS